MFVEFRLGLRGLDERHHIAQPPAHLANPASDAAHLAA
jgi:hypothetical protein